MSPAFDAFPTTQKKRWVHYINDDFFDIPDLDPLLERLLLRFECHARDRPWCDPTNDELMQQLGCSKNTLAALLTRGEALGWFRRVLIPGRHGRATARLGFVLFRRPTSRPVATDETFDQIVAQMTAEIRRGNNHPHTVPFRTDTPERTVGGAQKLGTAVPRNWAPTVPRNWAPPTYKEEITGETKSTTMTGEDHVRAIDIHASSESSLSSFAPDPEPEPKGDSAPIQVPGNGSPSESRAVNASTQTVVGVETPTAASAPPAVTELPAELVAAAAEAMPGVSREWVRSLLRDCGRYGLELALLVIAWVKAQRPNKPTRYARVSLAGWLTKLRAGELTVEDVRAEVHGRSAPRASPRPFDPAACLARLESVGWTIVPRGPDQVVLVEIPDRGSPSWESLQSDLRQQVESHKAELKAYVLNRAAERKKVVGRGA